MKLIKARIEKVVEAMPKEHAVVLRADSKAFLIYVGQVEAVAIHRELLGERSQRPLPHDLARNILTAFDIEVRKIVVSSIVNDVFCATLLLTQVSPFGGESPHRTEVRLDLRASDAMILALKSGSDIWVTQDVLDKVQDVAMFLKDSDEGGTPAGDD